MGFMDMEKGNDNANREALKMSYGGKFLNGIESMYVNSIVC